MKCCAGRESTSSQCRSLYWERGLKSKNTVIKYQKSSTSLPVLGAWIEMTSNFKPAICSASRSLYWERGLKYWLKVSGVSPATRRSLYWERGLKWFLGTGHTKISSSLPVLGAWIEIGKAVWNMPLVSSVAPCIGSVD